MNLAKMFNEQIASLLRLLKPMYRSGFVKDISLKRSILLS